MSEFKHLLSVARGQAPADTVITGAGIIDVHLGRIFEDKVLGLAGDKIAYLGPEQEFLIGSETVVEDLGGRYLIPGLIDGHTHLDSIFTVRAFAARSVPFGNTTAVTEVAMIAAALGLEGVEMVCEEAGSSILRCYFTCPSLTPPMPKFETSAGFGFEDFEEFINRPEVVGLGETYWPLVLDLDPRPAANFPRVQDLAKTIEGHAAGAKNDRLMAYRASGVESCHEAINIDEVRARLDLGMHVQIREGYIRREMEAIVPHLTRAEADSGLISLVSDVLDPEELCGLGGMNLMLKKAVALGMEPMTAIRMLTLYPARHFNLRLIGSINPGKLADLVTVENLNDFECGPIWIGGQKVADQGRLLVDQPEYEYPARGLSSFDLDPIQPRDLAFPLKGGETRAIAVNLATETITKPREIELPSGSSQLRSDPEQDLLLMSHLDRRGINRPSTCLVKGVGLRSGAIATSLIWDTNNILVIGLNEEEMAVAVNRILEMGGGLVAIDQGRVIGELAMPVGGIISNLDLEEIVAAYRATEEAVHSLGCTIKRPFLTVQTLSFTGLPFIRLTDKGLVDMKKRVMIEPVA